MNEIKDILSNYKTATGCRRCGYDKHPKALHFAHRDPKTKYRDKNGKIVEPSDMIKGKKRSRYGISTIMNEISKCDILCANCHAEETYE